MSGYPSIYAMVVFDLHAKVSEFLDHLNQEGQIDLDSSGYPYLIQCDRQGPNFVAKISRNNRMENFVLNPRKKAEPRCSWDAADGYSRPASQNRAMLVQDPSEDMNRRERTRRVVSMEAVTEIVDNILGD